MIITTKDNRKVELLKYSHENSGKLLVYLQTLGQETRNRFGPHSFTEDGISEIFNGAAEVSGYIATEVGSGQIVAYSLIMTDFLEDDRKRFNGYDVQFPVSGICTYAPSVGDQWQSSGLGSRMFEFIVEEIKQTGFSTMILWGGVQATNIRAVSFYLKHGFVEVGRFFHNGENIDMIRFL
ncbi:MAG: N-acetyltransferase family protein [Lentimicrobium sp.]